MAKMIVLKCAEHGWSKPMNESDAVGKCSVCSAELVSNIKFDPSFVDPLSGIAEDQAVSDIISASGDVRDAWPI